MTGKPVLITLASATVSISTELVRCTFSDGTFADCDIKNSHGPNYRGTAYFWGYVDHVRYAQHHDLIHCWLWDQLYQAPSPTLWAVAHNLPAPPENRFEEHLVNHVQYTLAQESDEYASFLEEHLGADWRTTLRKLEAVLVRASLPVPDRVLARVQ